MNKEKIEMMFKLMGYDYLGDAQMNLVLSYEKQFESKGYLSEPQFYVLESIFKQAVKARTEFILVKHIL
jgi:hypothetical protein